MVQEHIEKHYVKILDEEDAAAADAIAAILGGGA
jgi:hypothetical protein